MAPSRVARGPGPRTGERLTMQSRPSMSIFAALRFVWMPLEMQLLSGCGRALRFGSSHGCWVESSWFLGYSYVSKALAGIILDILAKVRRREPQNQTGFSLFVIAIVSEAQSKAT